MAEVSSFALLAELTNPYVIKLVHGLLNDCWVICQYACLEVSFVLTLHADTGSCQVGAANIDILAVKDEHLEVNTWTKHPLHAIIKDWVFVKVLSECLARLLCMNKPNLHTLTYKLRRARKGFFSFPVST